MAFDLCNDIDKKDYVRIFITSIALISRRISVKLGLKVFARKNISIDGHDKTFAHPTF